MSSRRPLKKKRLHVTPAGTSGNPQSNATCPVPYFLPDPTHPTVMHRLVSSWMTLGVVRPGTAQMSSHAKCWETESNHFTQPPPREEVGARASNNPKHMPFKPSDPQASFGGNNTAAAAGAASPTPAQIHPSNNSEQGIIAGITQSSFLPLPLLCLMRKHWMSRCQQMSEIAPLTYRRYDAIAIPEPTYRAFSGSTGDVSRSL